MALQPQNATFTGSTTCCPLISSQIFSHVETNLKLLWECCQGGLAHVNGFLCKMCYLSANVLCWIAQLSTTRNIPFGMFLDVQHDVEDRLARVLRGTFQRKFTCARPVVVGTWYLQPLEDHNRREEDFAKWHLSSKYFFLLSVRIL